MNANLFNRKSLLAGVLFAFAFSANAQVKSTHTDVRYGNTTVVYKDTTATDKDVLNALGDEYGLSDVVRVTVAPPKPAPAPTIDKSKGEDVWLVNPRNPEVLNLSVSSTNLAVINQINQPVNTATTPAPVVSPKPAPAPKAAPATIVPGNLIVGESNPPVIGYAASATAKAHVASGHSVKTVKKVTRKSGHGYGKAKSHKGGKRHFACPKF